MSAQYLLPCPQCDSKTTVVPKQAGQQITCGSCEAPFDVPKLGAMRSLELVETATEADPKSKERSQSPLKAWLFASGLVLAALAGAAGWGLYQYSSGKIQDVDIEGAIELRLAEYDKLTPVELYENWLQLNEQDLGDWQENLTIKSNKQGTILQNGAYGLFGLAGFGILLLASSFLIKKN